MTYNVFGGTLSLTQSITVEGLNENYHKYSPCKWALLKRFQGHGVKGEGHAAATTETSQGRGLILASYDFIPPAVTCVWVVRSPPEDGSTWSSAGRWTTTTNVDCLTCELHPASRLLPTLQCSPSLSHVPLLAPLDCYRPLSIVCWLLHILPPCQAHASRFLMSDNDSDISTIKYMSLDTMINYGFRRQKLDVSLSRHTKTMHGPPPGSLLRCQKQISGLFRPINPRKSWPSPILFMVC